MATQAPGHTGLCQIEGGPHRPQATQARVSLFLRRRCFVCFRAIFCYMSCLATLIAYPLIGTSTSLAGISPRVRFSLLARISRAFSLLALWALSDLPLSKELLLPLCGHNHLLPA